MTDRSSMQMEAEEQKLMKLAEQLSTADNLQEELLNKAMADGFTQDEAGAIVSNAMRKAANVDTGGEEKRGAFGMQHNPKNALAAVIARASKYQM
jgi:hypothetical protein